jgi:hypothetical protein
MVWILLHQLAASQVGAVEIDNQLILSLRFEYLGNINSLRDEHIVRFEDLLPIQDHSRKRVQAVKGQDRLRATADLGAGEGSPVDPLRLSDPLDLVLVFANEWIGNQLVVQQVKMNIGRELADGKVFGILFIGLFEFPVLVDRKHLARCHGGRGGECWPLMIDDVLRGKTNNEGRSCYEWQAELSRAMNKERKIKGD